MSYRAFILAVNVLSLACAANRTAPNSMPANMPRSAELGPTIDQARWAAPLVDTIVVKAERLDMRRGQLLTLATTIAAEGRTETGATVRGFFPVFLIETNGGVVELTERGLQAIGPGKATLVVLPLRMVPGRVVATRVPITVR
jgi:hypothetical protein